MITKYVNGKAIGAIFALAMALSSEFFYHGRGNWGFYDKDWLLIQGILNVIVFLQAGYWAYKFRGKYNNSASAVLGLLALLFNPIFFNPFTEFTLPGFRQGLWDFMAAIVLLWGLHIDITTELESNEFHAINISLPSFSKKLQTNNKPIAEAVLEQDKGLRSTIENGKDNDINSNDTTESIDVISGLEEKKDDKSLKDRIIWLFSFTGKISRKEYFILAVMSDLIGILLQAMFQFNLEQDLLTRRAGDGLSPIFAAIAAFSLVIAFIKFSAITRRIHALGKGFIWCCIACVLSRNLFLDVILIIYLSLKKGPEEQ